MQTTRRITAESEDPIEVVSDDETLMVTLRVGTRGKVVPLAMDTTRELLGTLEHALTEIGG